jgi:cytochrome b6-f complex iron-sulfur subunit
MASLVAATGLAGCGPSSPSSTAPPLPSVSGSVSGRTVSLTVDAGSPLAAVGSAAIVPTSLGSFLVARLGQDTFNVFTAVCTHEACTITGFSNGQFACPCHGSRYTTSGTVASGPAPRSLQQFTSQFSNSTLTFTA